MTDQVPHIRSSVLGDATIDFLTEPSNVPREPRATDKPIQGKVDSNPLDAISKLGDLQGDIQDTMRALTNAGDKVADLAGRVDAAFGSSTEQGRMRRFLDTTERAMNQFAQTMASLNEILGDESQPTQPNQLTPPAPPVPPPGNQPLSGEEMRQRLRQGLNEFPDAIHEFRIVLESANKNFKNLEGFTEPLGRNGPKIANSIVKAVDGLDRLVEEFTLLTNALNNREGTLGQLIHDRQLYENLNRLTLNANEVLGSIYRLAERLRPVVEDARVFMDKIAREPGRVISGAVGQPSVVK